MDEVKLCSDTYLIRNVHGSILNYFLELQGTQITSLFDTRIGNISCNRHCKPVNQTSSAVEPAAVRPPSRILNA